MSEVKISKCEDCPLLNREWDDVNGWLYGCNHPNSEKIKINHIELFTTPDWCLLKKEPLNLIHE